MESTITPVITTGQHQLGDSLKLILHHLSETIKITQIMGDLLVSLIN